MQSLGKVPSARRPPANLPSLKAETSSPAPQASTDQTQQQQPQINTSSASWAAELPSQSQPNLNASSASVREAQQSATSWSSVATGSSLKEENASQPPLYQSPQFQNEFPSLDGSTTSAMCASATSPHQITISQDSGETQMNLRPSTDAASWMQQQQNTTSGRGAGENGNYAPPELAVPPKFMALLPPFLRGSAMSGTSPNTQNQQGSSGNYQNQQRQNSSRGNYGVSSYNEYTNGPSRRQGPPPRYERGRHGNNNNNGNIEERSSGYEPESIVQRPIIKEEELERIDSLARDDGWSKHDEIDYNKKLQFSDDDVEDVKQKDGK